MSAYCVSESCVTFPGFIGDEWGFWVRLEDLAESGKAKRIKMWDRILYESMGTAEKPPLTPMII